MKTTAPTEAVSASPEENELWNTNRRRNTTCAGQKPRADWKNDLQTYEESRKSPKPPTPFVGIKPYGKCQLKKPKLDNGAGKCWMLNSLKNWPKTVIGCGFQAEVEQMVSFEYQEAIGHSRISVFLNCSS